MNIKNIIENRKYWIVWNGEQPYSGSATCYAKEKSGTILFKLNDNKWIRVLSENVVRII
jgi:hypothetical protein